MNIKEILKMRKSQLIELRKLLLKRIQLNDEIKDVRQSMKNLDNVIIGSDDI